MNIDEATLKRFWSKVTVVDGSCWEWTAGKNRWGYGKFRAFGRDIGAHRFSAMVYLASFSPELHALHRCDNPSCVNPEHLYMGTDADNARDRSERNRVRNQYRDATHCIHGHEWTAENTYMTTRGHRECRQCARRRVEEARRDPVRQAQRLAYWREYRSKQKASA